MKDSTDGIVLPHQKPYHKENIKVWMMDKACRNYALIDLARHADKSGRLSGSLLYFRFRWGWSSDEMQSFLKRLKQQGRIRMRKEYYKGVFIQEIFEIRDVDKFLMQP